MNSIHIPKPCDVSWSDMSLQDNGRFCPQCQCVVVDFSHMNDEEIRSYIVQRAGQKTCGYFGPGQLP